MSENTVKTPAKFFIDQIGDKGEILGYTTMVVPFLMVFFGIRTYPDYVLDGSIAFGKAFQVGILVTVIASVCYGAFVEPFSVGLVITLACAGILKRKRREPGASAAVGRAFTAM